MATSPSAPLWCPQRAMLPFRGCREPGGAAIDSSTAPHRGRCTGPDPFTAMSTEAAPPTSFRKNATQASNQAAVASTPRAPGLPASNPQQCRTIFPGRRVDTLPTARQFAPQQTSRGRRLPARQFLRSGRLRTRASAVVAVKALHARLALPGPPLFAAVAPAPLVSALPRRRARVSRVARPVPAVTSGLCRRSFRKTDVIPPIPHEYRTQLCPEFLYGC